MVRDSIRARCPHLDAGIPLKSLEREPRYIALLKMHLPV